VPPEELSSLKFFSAGAAPLDPSTQKAFEDRYGIPILLSYGATEFGGPVCIMTPALYAECGPQKFGSVGRPIPGAQIRIVDSTTGEELSAGAEGTLEVISPRLEPQWIRTSDLGVIDADGFLFLKGRADSAIMRGGFKLLPETIERALLTHPSVAEAAVVGIKDRRLGQIPAAAVRFKPEGSSPSMEDLELHLRGQVPSTHIPAQWRQVPELPRNASMKIDRKGVSQLFERH
jgi:acyl-coenzyme A synthetase/AMP-(fatty) acid ligase